MHTDELDARRALDDADAGNDRTNNRRRFRHTEEEHSAIRYQFLGRFSKRAHRIAEVDASPTHLRECQLKDAAVSTTDL